MSEPWSWIWPDVGPVPVHQGLDSEIFDRSDFPYSETFVREAVQNSLDARLDDSKPVRVNFTFRTDNIGPRGPFLQQMMAHRRDAGLGIPSEWDSGKIKWLIVEDFNSRGLSGSLTNRNGSDFWNYWLHFGLTSKDGSGRGGRGIGRVAFLIASRLQSVIAYTRRVKDGSTAVCGMAILKPLQDDDRMRSTHAYLAKQENGNIYTLHNSPEFHDQTRDAFSFSGYDGEYKSGLGLAIPYPHQELERDGILATAIENFAPAILGGDLVLNVDGRVLDAGSIEDIAYDVVNTDHLGENAAIRNNFERYLDLIRRAQTDAASESIRLPNGSKNDFAALRENPDTKDLQKRIVEREVLVLEISFPLTRNHDEGDVSLQAVIGTRESGRKPIDRLFREGMSLPKVRANNPGELDLVMLVSDPKLATYLNFCEGKAHLDLEGSKDVEQKLKDNGFRDLRAKQLVKSLPTELRFLLTLDVTEPDANVFDTYFSIPMEKSGKKKKPKKPVEPPIDIPPPKPPVFRVKTLDNGLRVTTNPDFTDWPVNLAIKIAYANGTRNPSWHPLDFKLTNLEINHNGCEISTNKNTIKALCCSRDTNIEITGFDKNRELDVNIRTWKDG